MARYLRNSTNRIIRWSRNRIYTISIIFIVVVIVALIYLPGLFVRGEDRPAESALQVDTNNRNTPRSSSPLRSASAERGRGPAPQLAAQAKPEPNTVKVSPERAPDSVGDAANPEVSKLIAEAVALINTGPGRTIEARDKLNKMLKLPMNKQQQTFVKEQLSKLAEQWLFSPSSYPDDKLCDSYKVQPGDRLEIIGRRYKVPYEILMQINNIRRAQLLKAGQTIKVIHGPFQATVHRTTFTMDLYLQDTFVRSFSVGLGQPGRETPTGLWRVKEGGKEISPPWTDPDTQQVYHPGHPNYPLGSRWIALEGLEGPAKDQTGFGIHGTKDPETIGIAGSRGCIRLDNGHAILVYNLLEPIYSTVRVEE